MKKYLLGFAAVVFAVAFSAYTKPAGAKRVNYYSLEYKAPGGSYSSTNVQSIALASWGNAISAPLGQLQLSCDQTATTEKACEIIVAESQLITDAGTGELRLKTSAEGGTVVIVAVDGDPSAHTGTFMVNKTASSNLFNADNKRF